MRVLAAALRSLQLRREIGALRLHSRKLYRRLLSRTFARELDAVMTLLTEERVVGVPRCRCSDTVGGSPLISSICGTKESVGVRRR
ncbi:hypothetical protein PLANPX_4226 [Lacipirellula parvula]|uniref:Uncharacterized protein n=1 Tax=Lacipirellula parvula TaxID=2650471 RepID=A0A5K7XCU8_9BACT|nr:hypothetical protein PLANPX_4226 [Lacipirellula parvula]